MADMHWALNLSILRIPLLSILAIGFVILFLIFISGGGKNNNKKKKPWRWFINARKYRCKERYCFCF